MNLLLTVSALTLAALAPGAAAAQGEQHEHHAMMGKVSYATTCSPKAAAAFEVGLSWLHSFEYDQAARSFAQADTADPRCAIAQWGLAMTYYHPLWAAPSAAELESGRKALAKAHQVGAASQREQDYIAALDAFYNTPGAADHGSRVMAYSDAMAQLHRRYPEDREGGVFYALALIAAGTLDTDPSFAREKEAGAILNAVLAVEPDHPGVAHYLIHSFDYPQLAQLALPAAKRYAGIAPASTHAQHMPSHIFTRLGRWDESISSNIASEAAARVFAKEHGLPDSSSERLHAMDYLAYAYLQTAQDEKAEGVLRDLYSIQRADPAVFQVAYAATAIPARLVLERRQWMQAASLELPDNVRSLTPLDKFPWGEAHIKFARAIGAARSGNVSAARQQLAALSAIEQRLVVPAGTYDWRTQVTIERQIAQAWLARAEGNNPEAERVMRLAADLDDATEKHPVMPGVLLPAREQLGELLLEVGQPAKALKEYQAAMTRAPRRLAGLYGAARAAKAAGDLARARGYYTQMLEMAGKGNRGRAELREAQAAARDRAGRNNR